MDQLVPLRGEDCSMLNFSPLALYVQPLGRSAGVVDKCLDY